VEVFLSFGRVFLLSIREIFSLASGAKTGDEGDDFGVELGTAITARVAW
jgi:hypothetical protein